MNAEPYSIRQQFGTRILPAKAAPPKAPFASYQKNNLQNQPHDAKIKRHGEGFETSPAPNRNRPQEGQVMAKKAIRPIRIEGNIAYVTLTMGYVAVIDATDVHLVDGANWTSKVTPYTVYAYRKDNFGQKNRNVYMHRVILGAPVSIEVDHCDRDGLNNRRSNLRAATKSQNQHNKGVQSNNSSGYRGVSWDGAARKWLAQITVGCKQVHLGRHEKIEDACHAYRTASARFHGAFGRSS